MTEQQLARFWRFVQRGDAGACWPWQGHVMACGYGQWAAAHHCNKLAHRVAYEATHGPIPEGLVLDHLCRNKACCNPAHLEAVTQRTNVLRGTSFVPAKVAQTHCIHGHELTGANLIVRPDGRRNCRQCHRDWERTHYAARRGTHVI